MTFKHNFQLNKIVVTFVGTQSNRLCCLLSSKKCCIRNHFHLISYFGQAHVVMNAWRVNEHHFESSYRHARVAAEANKKKDLNRHGKTYVFKMTTALKTTHLHRARVTMRVEHWGSKVVGLRPKKMMPLSSCNQLRLGFISLLANVLLIRRSQFTIYAPF